jgi:hypothetical protein
MAAGDIVGNTESVNDAAYMTIQPGAGVDYNILALIWSASVEIYLYDGVNEAGPVSATGAGGWPGVSIPVNNADYLRVKNVSGGVQIMGWRGIQTK